MTYDTAVVGGGISGMVCALELARCGQSVVLYEAAGELGGLAKSSGKDAEFDEHSWRSFGPFYQNLKDVMQTLGIAWPTAEVNLTPFPPVPFQISRGDLKMFGRIVKGMTSLSLQPYQTQSWFDSNKGVSKWGMVTLARFNKSGSDYRDLPTATLIRVVEMLVASRDTSFRISPLPIQEYLIEPLRLALEQLGVVIKVNTPVRSLRPQDLDAKTVVSAIPPHAYGKLDTSGLYPFAVKKMEKLAVETRHQEISYRIVFNRRLEYPKRLTFDLHETAWGLLMIPCDLYHSQSTWSTSVWSGTCTYMNHEDRHGRQVRDCSLAQFQESVLEQLMGCQALHEWFLGSGVNLAEALGAITHFRVWKGWSEGVDGKLQSREVMTVNNYRESWSRPMAGSKLGANVFLAGAHAGTGTQMWLMESAAEAGKRAAIALLNAQGKNADKIYVDTHERHPVRFALLSIGTLVGVVMLVIRLCY